MDDQIYILLPYKLFLQYNFETSLIGGVSANAFESLFD